MGLKNQATRYKKLPGVGCSPTKILGNLVGNMVGKKLGGDKYAGGKTAAGKALDVLGSAVVGFARGIFGKK